MSTLSSASPERGSESNYRSTLLVSLFLIVSVACPVLHDPDAWISSARTLARFKKLTPDGAGAYSLQEEDIAIDPQSIMAPDLVAIRHVPGQAKFVVQLKPQRTVCPHPVLVGRLSGPALATIDWKPLQEDKIVGYYKTPESPSSNTYFIEIIVEYCRALQWDDDFKNMCVENVYAHRITSKESTFHMAMQQRDLHKKLGYGAWRRKRQYDSDETGEVYTGAVYTRVQPPECVQRVLGHKKSVTILNTTSCDNLQSLDRFAPYEFVWNIPSQKALALAWRHSEDSSMPTSTRLCFYGASHSRYLAKYVSEYLNQRKLDKVVTVVYLKSLSSEGLMESQSFIQRNCDKVVVGVGQWDAGWPWGGPTLFPEYYIKMQQVAEFMQRQREQNRIEFYLRAMHRNPLGYRMTACPPADWRTPTVVRQYNNITRQLSEAYNIPYLDTDWLLHSVWDSAYDWCHYGHEFSETAGRVEAEYILAKLLAIF